MEKLKELYGEKAMTYAELEAALKDNKDIKLANLAAGGYVAKEKHDAKITELATANQAISDLQKKAAEFEGVDVGKLKTDIAGLQEKYTKDIAEAKITAAVDLALAQAGAKNIKLVRGALEHDKIKLEGESITGLQEQIEAIKKSDAYLFGGTTTTVKTGKDHEPEGPAEESLADVIKGRLYKTTT